MIADALDALSGEYPSIYIFSEGASTEREPYLMRVTIHAASSKRLMQLTQAIAQLRGASLVRASRQQPRSWDLVIVWNFTDKRSEFQQAREQLLRVFRKIG